VQELLARDFVDHDMSEILLLAAPTSALPRSVVAIVLRPSIPQQAIPPRHEPAGRRAAPCPVALA